MKFPDDGTRLSRLSNGVVILLLALGLSLTSCSTPQTEARGPWRQLPALPDREGFAGMFAGVAAGQLVVAGGANFPDKKPWEGGKKVWYDTVFVLEHPHSQWKLAGKLPRPLGYGVSLTVNNGIACLGGSDAEKHFADCFLLALEKGQLQIRPLPTLPLPIAHAGGAVIGETIYLCGGADQPGEQAALNRLFSLDLNAASPAWTELESCPGRPRILPVAASANGAFYLAGGADFVRQDGKMVRDYLWDVWCYQPGRGWRRLANLPKPSVGAPSPAPVVGSSFYLAGGDDGTLVGYPSIVAHPETHPGFSNQMRAFDTRKNQWRAAGEMPAPRATLPAVWWQGRYVLPSGEVRPGVRSPEVWTWEIRNTKSWQKN